VASPEYIDNLKAVIGKLRGCGSTHVESVPVHEVFQGETVWETVLELPPVVSPKTAVQVSVLSDIKKRNSGQF
jgi:hypothetical protein